MTRLVRGFVKGNTGGEFRVQVFFFWFRVWGFRVLGFPRLKETTGGEFRVYRASIRLL